MPAIAIRAIGGQPIAQEAAPAPAPIIEKVQEQQAAPEPYIRMAIPLFYEGSTAVKQGDEKNPIAAYELSFKARVTAADYAYIVGKIEGHELMAEFSRPDGIGGA